MLDGDSYNQSFHWMLEQHYVNSENNEYENAEDLHKHGGILSRKIQERGPRRELVRRYKNRMRELVVEGKKDNEEYRLIVQDLADISTSRIAKTSLLKSF
ncbi:unnamed protein product [marine sediment metagenome]|uniref:Uncharacterized protein n=1 Tax=marine sediment metagenome TaxID=412755 RepID=X1CSE5_9ZZZZ